MRNTLFSLLVLSLSLSASADYRITMKTTFNNPAAASMKMTSTTEAKDKRELVINTTEMPGGKSVATYSLTMCDTEQQAELDPDAKIYTLKSLRPSFLPESKSGQDSPLSAGVGKVVSNFAVQDKGVEKVGSTDARHWIVDTKMSGSGCVGDFHYDTRREFWTAKLPTFVCPILSSWGNQTIGQCKVTMERSGDVAKFDESQQGQVVKEIMYQNGEPMMTREMTEFSKAELSAAEFSLDGYRKVTQAEFDKARQEKMMKMYMP